MAWLSSPVNGNEIVEIDVIDGGEEETRQSPAPEPDLVSPDDTFITASRPGIDDSATDMKAGHDMRTEILAQFLATTRSHWQLDEDES